MEYLGKNSLPYKKIKLTLKIKRSNEGLAVIIFPTPRIVIKRIE